METNKNEAIEFSLCDSIKLRLKGLSAPKREPIFWGVYWNCEEHFCDRINCMEGTVWYIFDFRLGKMSGYSCSHLFLVLPSTSLAQKLTLAEAHCLFRENSFCNMEFPSVLTEADEWLGLKRHTSESARTSCGKNPAYHVFDDIIRRTSDLKHKALFPAITTQCS